MKIYTKKIAAVEMVYYIFKLIQYLASESI